ncbi:MAG: DUF3185 family protein [Alphaproteobacteria bacterium]|nr:MAG: DUF3185 family protein [Alphaproteobacteria bacterium]
MIAARVAAVALGTAGVVMLGSAWQSSGAPLERLSEALTGRYTDQTTWIVLAGATALVCAAYLAFVHRD